jgi:tRNA (guanine26-N2/guanine27-N2)-dimethyltransferase
MFSRAARWSLSRLPVAFGGGPAADAAVGGVPKDCEELVEGMAKIIFKKGQVFYNPVQVVNRDLSVLVLRWLQRQRAEKPMRILEALSATGLRAIRYAKEVPRVEHVLANDLDPGAVQTIARNVAHNTGDVSRRVIPSCGDAISVMTAARAPGEQYDVVDLDPYGGAAPFLDSAVQAVADGGILAVTCTDLAVLCGNSPETCFARYGAAPLKGASSHEMAVRIVLFAINAAANRHGRSIEVLLCVKIDFYVRLFVRLRDSKATAQLSHSRTMAVYQCSGCGTQRFQFLGRVKDNATSNSKKRRKKDEVAGQGVSAPSTIRKFLPSTVASEVKDRCSICDGTMVVGGPIYAGPLADVDVCESILDEINSGVGTFQARDRVDALVRVAAEEVQHAPLFMQLNAMCGVLKTNAPPAASLRTYLTENGYKVSQSHTDPLALKTDAPPELIWDLLRVWSKQSNSDKKKPSNIPNEKPVQQTVGQRILAIEPTLVSADSVNFSIKRDALGRGLAGGADKRKSAPRFLPNPEPYWGPKARAQPLKQSKKRGREE